MNIGVLFSGQGAQKVGMGASLAGGSERVRALYARADEVLGWSLSRICCEGPDAELTQTKVCQPALFVHGYAVYSLLEERGLLKGVSVAAGLSLGEVTALTAAGAFSFETGLEVVAERGRLMQLACEQSRGTMAAVIGEERAKVEELCRDFDIDLANINSPGQLVISGAVENVQKAVEAGKERGMKRVTLLNVAGAYHSRLMEPARAAFEIFLAGMPVAAPRYTVLTNTTGGPVATPQEIRAALVRQVVSPVLWTTCIETAASQGITQFYECGVGGVLAGLVRRINKDLKVSSVAEWSELPPAA
jgi:[acyl-carrier-protein] S-malonyltransferase